MKTITRVLLCVMLVAMLATWLPAQTQSAGCGGANCVQKRMPAGEPLDQGSALLGIAQNGARIIFFVNEEDVTLSTGGATTDTTNTLLPANSIILGGSANLITAITGTCTGWQLGDPTTAGRFTASNTTLTAGTTDIFRVHATTGIASATTGMWQASAAKVRVTCATGAPATGKVRVMVYGFTITPPLL